VTKKYKLLIIIAVLTLLIAFCFYQNKHLTVTYYTYANEKLGSDFEGYRIVQISDLHNAVFGRNNERLLHKMEALNPDMIVITGDVVDSNHTNIDIAVSFVQEAVKLCPVYYVTGNHEYWLESETLSDMLSRFTDAGAQILSNRAVYIGEGNSEFALIGLEDVNLSDDTLEGIVRDLDDKKFRLLLAHEPQYLENYSRAKVDLALTGHAHGGQFRLPLVGGVVAPDQGFWPEYTEGEHMAGDTTMIVSRGLGNSIIPLRLFNYPEIVCVNIASQSHP